MKKWILRSWALGLFLGLVGNVQGQALRFLRPDYLQVQYAGSIGWLSAGAGYNLLNGRARVGAQYGYVPPAQGGALHLVSAAFFYEPWRWKVSGNLQINPLDVGLKTSYHFGDEFYTSLPSRYPENYYWWKSALRFHLATQTALTWQRHEAATFKTLTGYVECTTNELYLVSYLQNHTSLRPSDIIKLGLGLRVAF